MGQRAERSAKSQSAWQWRTVYAHETDQSVAACGDCFGSLIEKGDRVCWIDSQDRPVCVVRGIRQTTIRGKVRYFVELRRDRGPTFEVGARAVEKVVG